MKEIDKILDSKEKVFWEGRPKFWPFFLSGFAGALFGLIFLIVGGIFVIMGILSGNYFFIFIPHFWIGVVFVFGIPLYKALVYSHTYYAITHKRIILQKGLIGRDFETVDFDQITNAEVNVGVLDKLFGGGSGSILLSTAGTFTYTRRGPIQKPYTISHIANPYEVFKFFKKVSHDVKTDIHFPNKYRPTENPGYRTHYNVKK
ncbi:PH domain-containing protein [Candidatus Pacearchaeota archaeon]|nr:PH domain-containing protein [Candidatus Pacearchaeota archaeon]